MGVSTSDGPLCSRSLVYPLTTKIICSEQKITVFFLGSLNNMQKSAVLFSRNEPFETKWVWQAEFKYDCIEKCNPISFLAVVCLFRPITCWAYLWCFICLAGFKVTRPQKCVEDSKYAFLTWLLNTPCHWSKPVNDYSWAHDLVATCSLAAWCQNKLSLIFRYPSS